jgi:hypothetical protein
LHTTNINTIFKLSVIIENKIALGFQLICLVVAMRFKSHSNILIANELYCQINHIMRKIILMLFVSALSLPAFAQSVKFGVKTGLNESTPDVDKTSSDFSNLSGLNAGAFAEFEFGKLSLQPGLYFTQKGFNSKTSIIVPVPQGGPSGSFNATGRVRLNYLQLPVNVLYNIAVKPGKIFLGGGPYYGYALSGNVKGSTISVYPGQGNFTIARTII